MTKTGEKSGAKKLKDESLPKVSATAFLEESLRIPISRLQRSL